MMCKCVTFILVSLVVCFVNGHSTQRPSRERDDDSNPFLDIAASFLQDTLSNQNGGGRAGNGVGGIASLMPLIGSLMQPDGASKSNNGGLGAAQIISSISSLMANANGGRDGGGGGGLDPSIIGNIIEMFTAGAGNSDDSNDLEQPRRKRSNDGGGQEGFGLEAIMNIASAFLGNANEADSPTGPAANEGLMSLLPMVLQAINSFAGPEGDRIHAKHRDHAWVLPPFLEKIHVIWDHFSNSELADALWQKSGVNLIFKVGLD